MQTTLHSNTTETTLAWEQPIAKRMAERLPQDYQSWRLAAPVPNKAGGKSAGIVDQSGSPITLYTAPLRVPFDAQGFQDETATRVNLCLEANEAITKWAQGLDAHIVALMEARSQVFFGKVLNAAEVSANYHSAIKEADKYGAQLLKLKMNKAGRGCVRVWNEAGIPRSQPATWQDCTVQARATLKGIWIQGRSFGLTWEAVDVLIKTEGDAMMECPFQTA